MFFAIAVDVFLSEGKIVWCLTTREMLCAHNFVFVCETLGGLEDAVEIAGDVQEVEGGILVQWEEFERRKNKDGSE